MKRKFVVFTIVLTVCLSCLALVGCNLSKKDPNESQTPCEHIVSGWKVGDIATCTTNGYRYKECTVCHEEMEREAITATGHRYSNTLTYDEYYHWYPSTCGHDVQKDKTEHIFNNYECSCGYVYYSKNLSYTISYDATYYTVSGKGNCSDTSIVIPAKYNNLPVKEIGDNAFANYSSITSIVIPNSVVVIGNEAFYNCSGLEEIAFPSSVTNIGYSAFRGCNNLTSIEFDDTLTWCVTTNFSDWFNKEKGTFINVTNPSTNVINLAVTYEDYYWFRNDDIVLDVEKNNGSSFETVGYSIAKGNYITSSKNLAYVGFNDEFNFVDGGEISFKIDITSTSQSKFFPSIRFEGVNNSGDNDYISGQFCVWEGRLYWKLTTGNNGSLQQVVLMSTPGYFSENVTVKINKNTDGYFEMSLIRGDGTVIDGYSDTNRMKKLVSIKDVYFWYFHEVETRVGDWEISNIDINPNIKFTTNVAQEIGIDSTTLDIQFNYEERAYDFYVELYHDNTIISRKALNNSSTSITFKDLNVGNYRYVIVAEVIENSQLARIIYLKEKRFTINGPVIFDDVKAYQNAIYFGFDWNDAVINQKLDSLKLVYEDGSEMALSVYATMVNNLEMNKKYTLIGKYSYNGKTYEIKKSVFVGQLFENEYSHYDVLFATIGQSMEKGDYISSNIHDSWAEFNNDIDFNNGSTIDLNWNMLATENSRFYATIYYYGTDSLGISIKYGVQFCVWDGALNIRTFKSYGVNTDEKQMLEVYNIASEEYSIIVDKNSDGVFEISFLRDGVVPFDNYVTTLTTVSRVAILFECEGLLNGTWEMTNIIVGTNS